MTATINKDSNNLQCQKGAVLYIISPLAGQLRTSPKKLFNVDIRW